MMLRLKSDVVCTMSVLLLISMGVQSENQVLIAVWVSSCERLSMTTDQISVSEFMVAIGSAPSMIFPARVRWYQPYQYSKNS